MTLFIVRVFREVTSSHVLFKVFAAFPCTFAKFNHVPDILRSPVPQLFFILFSCSHCKIYSVPLFPKTPGRPSIVRNFLGIFDSKLCSFLLAGFDALFEFPIEEVEDDPDILEDPIYSMDIQVNTSLHMCFGQHNVCQRICT